MQDQTAEASKEVQIANIESKKLAGEIYAVKIRSDKDLSNATNKLGEVKKMAKEIEKRRKLITQPLNAAIKEVNAMFKDPADRLADAEKLIKEAIIKYQTRIEARATKQAQKIEDAVESGEMTLSEGMGKLGRIKQGSDSVQAESGTASFRKNRKIVITDPGALPAKYFLRDSVIEALRKEVDKDVRQNGLDLPTGADWIEVQTVAVRTA